MKPSKKIPNANSADQPSEAVAPDSDPIEGEGSYTAGRRYDAGVAETVASGNVEELAQIAKRAMEGGEAKGLSKAVRKAAKRGESVPVAKHHPR